MQITATPEDQYDPPTLSTSEVIEAKWQSAAEWFKTTAKPVDKDSIVFGVKPEQTGKG